MRELARILHHLDTRRIDDCTLVGRLALEAKFLGRQPRGVEPGLSLFPLCRIGQSWGSHGLLGNPRDTIVCVHCFSLGVAR